MSTLRPKLSGLEPTKDAMETLKKETVVEFQGVWKYFGELAALQDVNLTVGRGEVVVIVGPSGSGKSTLCRTINRLEIIDKGSIFVDGKPQPVEGKELYKFRTEVGMVFQSFNLFSHKSILENVTLAPRKIRGQDKASAEDRAYRLLDMVGIRSKANSMPAQLSGGQRQRAAIARALAMDPKVILFGRAPIGWYSWRMEQSSRLRTRKLSSVRQRVSALVAFSRPCVESVWFLYGPRRRHPGCLITR